MMKIYPFILEALHYSIFPVSEFGSSGPGEGRVKVPGHYNLSQRPSAALECGGLPPLCFRELARGSGRRQPGQQAGRRDSGGLRPLCFRELARGSGQRQPGQQAGRRARPRLLWARCPRCIPVGLVQSGAFPPGPVQNARKNSPSTCYAVTDGGSTASAGPTLGKKPEITSSCFASFPMKSQRRA